MTGDGVITNGTCTITLPDYIHALVKQEGSQVQLTNIGHGEVLWVESIDVNKNQFKVATKNSIDLKFFWSFTAIRKDVEDIDVECD